jgi:hypothetical protein
VGFSQNAPREALKEQEALTRAATALSARAAAEDVSIGNHPDLTSSKAYQKSGSFPPPELPGFHGSMTLSDTRRSRRSYGDVEVATPPTTGLPQLPALPSQCAVSVTPADQTGACVDCYSAFAVIRGIRTFTFEACSDFTRVTARWTAQPTTAAFVTRLRPAQLPERAARQLPDQSTTHWVESSSTGDSRWPSFAANV